MGLILKVAQGTHLKGTTIFPMNGWRSHPVIHPCRPAVPPPCEGLAEKTWKNIYGLSVGGFGTVKTWKSWKKLRNKLQVTGSYCWWSRNLANQFLSYKVLDLPSDAEFLPSTESVFVSRRESFVLIIDNVIIDKYWKVQVQYLATDNIMKLLNKKQEPDSFAIPYQTWHNIWNSASNIFAKKKTSGHTCLIQLSLSLSLPLPANGWGGDLLGNHSGFQPEASNRTSELLKVKGFPIDFALQVSRQKDIINKGYLTYP